MTTIDATTRIKQTQAQADALARAVGDFFEVPVGTRSDGEDPLEVAMEILSGAYVTRLHRYQHPDDAAVDRFASAMRSKLARSRDKGRGGWDDPDQCSVDFLADLLVGHLDKTNPGNLVDIANLCLMLHEREAPGEAVVEALIRAGIKRESFGELATAITT